MTLIEGCFVEQQVRQDRLQADHQALAALAAASSIFSFSGDGESADRYTLMFRGKGLARQASSATQIMPIELHQIDLRMPYAYPASPPDVRWLTPLWHPNVSFSGFVNMDDMGLAWSVDLPLDVLCERLWDMARAAYMNPDKAANYPAKTWFQRGCSFKLPVDPRPLRDRAPMSGSNIVRYQRRTGKPVQLTGAPASREVMFIDESTPTPPLPPRRPYIPVGRRRGNDDVLYIGPE
jgi:ubiquitin-conjugating enzyme